MAKRNSSSKKSNQGALLERFDDIFACTICLMKLDNPHLCPHCSKLYCLDCISAWLQSKTEQRLNCPNCKCELQLDKLVKVRWFEDAEKLQRCCLEPTATTSSTNKRVTRAGVNSGATECEGESVQKKDICSIHQKTITFYCCSCKQCVCYECADEYHLDHTFKNLDVIYDSDLQIAEEEFEKVRQHTMKVASVVKKVQHNVELVKKVEEEKIREIRLFAEAAIEGLKRQVNDKLQKLESSSTALTAEMKGIEQSLGKMEREVKASSRSQFVAKRPRLVKDCSKILMNPIKDFKQIQEPIGLKIETPNIYETGMFVMENFSSLNASKWVISNRFSDGFGHTWVIMARRVVDENRLGLFVQLVEGSSCWMEGRFQLLHQDSRRIVERKTIHEYCRFKEPNWGFNTFVTLKRIVDDHYLKDDDSLEFLYHIRPCKAPDGNSGK